MDRKRIILAGLLVLGLMGMLIALQLSRSGKLVVAAPAQTQYGAEVSVSVTNQLGGEETFKLKPGQSKTLTLPRGRALVSGEAGNLKSIDVVTVRGWGSSTQLTTPVGEQRQAEKLASSSEECPLVVGSSEFSAACGSGGPIYRHLPVSRALLEPKELLFKGESFGYTQVYDNGYTGFIDGTSDRIIYLDPVKRTAKLLELPPTIVAQMSRDEPLLVTADDQPSPYFAVVLKKINKIYLFKKFDSKSFAEVKLGKDIHMNDLKKAFDFQIVGDQFVMFEGNNEHYEGEEGYDPEKINEDVEDYYSKDLKKIPQYIYEYNLSGEQTKRLKLPGGVASTVGFDKLAGGFYALRTNFSADIYQADGDNLKLVFGLPDVTDVLPLKDKTYFAAKGAVYEFRPGDDGLFSLRSVFYSPTLKVSDLAHASDGLIFTALSNRGSRTALDIFRLRNEKQSTPLFEEQIEFYKLSRLVTGYDYDDKTIVFYLGVGGSQGPSYDDLLRGMKSQLKELKVDVGGRKVELGALN